MLNLNNGMANNAKRQSPIEVETYLLNQILKVQMSHVDTDLVFFFGIQLFVTIDPLHDFNRNSLVFHDIYTEMNLQKSHFGCKVFQPISLVNID